MHIVVITGTQIKGCTHALTELFMQELRAGNSVETFTLPKDGPPYCTGCKTCFFHGEDKCPHADTVTPLWQAMLRADLLVFSYPVYALRAPAQVKALLDHLCVHWFVHRPEPALFPKRAVIITQAIGFFYSAALRDVKTSLTWLGVSDVRTAGFGLLEGVYWDEISTKRKGKFARKLHRLAGRYHTVKPARMKLSVRGRFLLMKWMHRLMQRNAAVLSLDDQYWKDTFLTKA
jgi:NAD(P)H-dependent FMN reductase